MMKKIILLCLTIILCCIACSKPEISTLGSISGIVVDALSKDAISGVKVTLTPGGSSQLTGKDGTFSFEELESQEYTLSFTKDNYESENQKVMVRANISSNVQISLSPIQPILAVNTNVLNFGNETSTLAIDITNAGKGVLKWNISENIDWISCSPDKGETEEEKSTLVVTADRSKLEQGIFSESFVVASNGGSATIVVSISVNNIKLSVEPSELDFETLSNSKQLLLTNTAAGSLRYTVSSSRSWLTLSKESGSITTSDYISAVVSREGLSAGHYDANIVFSTDGGEITVPVKMDVAVNETPTVTVESVSEIKFNSALLHGTVVSVGSDKITRYGFCWSEKSTPTIEDNFSNLGDCSTAEAFESIANNLKSETKYYFRAYAENNVGLVYSEKTLSFTTTGLPSLPGVSTGSVENVTANTARAKGTLTSLGNVDKITHYGHVWGLSAKPTLEDAKYSDLGEATTTSSFVSDVSELSSHTTYYIRAYATNEKGTSYGEDITFVTSKEDAKVSTSEVTEIVHNAATCGGVITQTGGHTITEKGVCYGKNAFPTVNDSKQVATSEKDASFSCRITGLEKETTYHVRAYVKTSDNTLFYGDDLSFKTTKEVELPTLSSVTISNIQTTSATFVGTIISDGESEITECGFCWSDVAEPTVTDNIVNCDPQSADMGKNITSLKEGTTYYVRSFAKNAMGIAYSETATFSTKAVTKPTVGNIRIENVGRTTAYAYADIIDSGNTEVMEVGFCWSTTSNPSTYDNKVICTSEQNFSAKLTGLPPLSTVYVRAYAINSKGTGYSDDVSITTIDTDTDVWDGISCATAFGGGTGTETDPIIISSAAMLKLLQQKVDNGTAYQGIHFALDTDIDLQNYSWEPIGDNYNPFKGVFDGKGHQIKNLFVTGSNDLGLFGCVKYGSLLSIRLTGRIKGTDNIGGLCGYFYCNGGISVQISDCDINCAVNGEENVGGLVGYLYCEYDGTILVRNCINRNAITGLKNVGGLFGYAKSYGYNDSKTAKTTVKNVLNLGTIRGNSACAGIIGYCHRESGWYSGIGDFDIYNAVNYTEGIEIGIIGNAYSSIGISGCLWLNDLVNAIGNQTGFGNTSVQYKNIGVNNSYFSRNNVSCFTMPDNQDILVLLNDWIVDNDIKCKKWKYEVIDGYARPVFDK